MSDNNSIFSWIDWIGIVICLAAMVTMLFMAGCIHDVIYAEEASEELILWLIR